MSDNKLKLASGILPIATDTGNLCLGWRSKEIREGNVWGVIGGMVKDGLTVEEGAILEMHEEVGYYGHIDLHKAHVHRRPGFQYHAFIGIVPTQFQFNPQPEFAFETSFISWMSYQTVTNLIASDSHTFHPGVVELFRESGDLIQRLINEKANLL